MRSLSEFGLREDDSVMEVKAASLSRSDGGTRGLAEVLFREAT